MQLLQIISCFLCSSPFLLFLLCTLCSTTCKKSAHLLTCLITEIQQHSWVKRVNSYSCRCLPAPNWSLQISSCDLPLSFLVIAFLCVVINLQLICRSFALIGAAHCTGDASFLNSWMICMPPLHRLRSNILLHNPVPCVAFFKACFKSLRYVCLCCSSLCVLQRI